MKKSRNLLILVIVLVVLGGAYWLISSSSSGDKTAAEDTGKIKLSVVDVKKIVNMSLSSKEGTIVIERNGENWVNKNDPAMKVDQETAAAIATSFANIYADRLVDEAPSKLDEYGLKEPEAKAAALLDDGSKVEVSLGSQAPGGGGYYMLFGSDPKLYLIASTEGARLRSTVSDIRDKAVTVLKSDSINNIKITSGDKVIELNRIPGDTKELQDIGYTSWVISKPYSGEYPADSTEGQTLADSIEGLKISKFVDDNPSDLGKYGLDKPAKEIAVLGAGGKLNIYIGNKADNGDVYFKTGDSNAVYTMDQNSAAAFNKDAFNLLDKYVYSVSLDSVNQIIIERAGQKDVLDITRTTKPAASSGGQDEVSETFKVNGKDVDGTKFKDFYQKLIGLTYETEGDKKVERNPEITVTFMLNKETVKQQTIVFSPYNADFYAVFRGGSSDFLISKSQVQNVLNSIKDLTS